MNKINYGFDSTEERYFYDWLTELHNAGMIDWIYSERKTYRIVDEVRANRLVQLKTKSKIQEIYKKSLTPFVYDCQNKISLDFDSKTVLKCFGSVSQEKKYLLPKNIAATKR